ncbi:MAG: nickel-dependent hydrogenase large subunit [Candidatus Thiodiazotropha sp.]
MNVEGEIQIVLYRRQERIEKVAIRSSRPLQLTRLFEGKSVKELLSMLPMLYSVCATAQASAAAQACRQAMGIHGNPRVELAEGMLVAVETAREHLWRILIDWSKFADVTVDRSLVASLSNLLPMAKHACFNDNDLFTLYPRLVMDQEKFSAVIELITKTAADSVFEQAPADWYACSTIEDFDDWLEQTTTATSKLLRRIRDEQSAQLADAGSYPLPAIDPLAICRRLAEEDADQFIAAPEWNGAVFETTPMTRMASHPLLRQLTKLYGFGLLTRLVARLMELASIPAKLNGQLQALIEDCVESSALKPGLGVDQGMGQVEAARGRLIHRAVLDKGVVAGYQIVAPTEWNFHPRGVVARGLLTLPAREIDALKRHADLFINAVDPCVGYRLEIV